jgi:pimeloyl-ACP methyl ester carboxylesterase
MRELDVTTRDGRMLHVYEAGAPDGFPVVYHHGTPSSGRPYGAWADDARERGVRLIGFDRAGYGGSTPRLGRSVRDVVEDVVAILDELDAGRFATWGWSGGGPHALACAALLPERCVAAATIASVAPYGVDGLDWLAGMGEANVAEFDLVLAGAEALEPALVRERDRMFAAGPEGLREAMLTILSPADQAAFTADLAGWLYGAMSEGTAERIDGWRDDNLAFVRPWGFETAEIGIPVRLLQGGQDLMVPAAHGRWLAAHIPGVEAEIDEAEGHVTLAAGRVPNVHEWLLGRSTG